MVAAGFKVGIKWGNLATLRLMLGFMAQPWIHFGLRIERIQPPGCEPAYWLSLKSASSSADSDSSSEQTSSSAGHPGSSQQPDVVLCYVHGGAFVAGHPLMCVMTFERWMKALARQGINCKVLCIQYPLAPERPFPAAVASTAAVFAWVGQQHPAGCGTTVIAVGDSAGGNIVPTSLAALRDYMQQQHPKPAQLPIQQQQQQQQEKAQEQPATHSTTEAIKASSAGDASTSKPMHADSAVVAPAGEADHGVTTSSSAHGAALTAAIEAHMFADLHNRLTVMAAKTSSSTINGASSSTSASASRSAALLSAVRMPSSIILVSPATDISPTACFRTRKAPHMASAAASSSCDTPAAATESTALPPCSNTSNGSGSNPSSSNGNGSSSISLRRPHYDYLPEDLESGGMGSYAEHHEQLCGVYASPVHLPSVEGLCAGRWLVLSGGVELLHPDIER
jgi:acetyl esterase/lipase